MTTATATTIKDQFASLDLWQARIDDSTADYATDEWKARARATVDEHRRYIGALVGRGMDADTPLPTFRDVAYGNTERFFDEAERWAILWQFQRHLSLGAFTSAIIEAADAGDSTNLDTLALAFPKLVEGIRRWRHEDGFAERIRAILVTTE